MVTTVVEGHPTRAVVQEGLQAQAALGQGPSSNVDEAGVLVASIYDSLQLHCRRLDVPQVALKQGYPNSPAISMTPFSKVWSL